MTRPVQDAVDSSELDTRSVRADFPLLAKPVRGKRRVYLDSAATSQKPQVVLDAVREHYEESCANVHRGIHDLSTSATVAYESARDKLQHFVGAASRDEIVFTSGTTNAVNLVAHAFGQRFVHAGDEIIVTRLEHHSNLVPWQMLCKRAGANLRVVPIGENGDLELDELKRLLCDRTRLVALSHTSNALGTRNPLETIIPLCHDAGAQVFVDGAQAMVHEPVDVKALDCDYFALSGHKMLGPTGTGVLYGKYERLLELPPFFGGGEMILSVQAGHSTYKDPPYRFEAGTPNIAGLIGLGAAADYLGSLGLDRIQRHDQRVVGYAAQRLSDHPHIRMIGHPRVRSGVVSFEVDGIHPHDVGQMLDAEGVAVRAGHHCAQPVMDFYGVPSTVRASFACYNDTDDVDLLIEAIDSAIRMMG
ncbi:MAG: cysteine desulfurase [Acidobacteriota bacterium]|nr:cysteine desulfurase [Acidobacteriota bacterium]